MSAHAFPSGNAGEASSTTRGSTTRGEESPLEMWGGVECTINRVGDQYFNQLARTSHWARLDDMDRFAELGVRALRFPLLWEEMQPQQCTPLAWKWSDRALARLRKRGVRPILGLLHHGYGPSWAGMLDQNFATHFAQYAGEVAKRYPWIDLYTPINEPLTTARFSGLYGHWYPHAHDARCFATLFFAQCNAIRLAMRAIRAVNPNAQLLQTEDLGAISSTPVLYYQRDFENARRWLTWDVLSGQLDPAHPLWKYMRSLGLPESTLSTFVEDPCPPDLLGVNYYVTSERFLDHRVERYDDSHIGGNGRHLYADVAAVHTPDTPYLGIGTLLGQAWERYRQPLAVTECHLGCTREEQLRWLYETWRTGVRLREDGVDLRAVTTWALLGSYDWDSLVTQQRGHYEPGAFDVRSPRPRPTAIAKLVRTLSSGSEVTSSMLDTPGWWRRHRRATREGKRALMTRVARQGRKGGHHSVTQRCLLITGARGTLGQALAHACESRGLSYQALDRSALDIADATAIEHALDHHRPWGVINAAGYVQVDRAESDRLRCIRENTVGPTRLARACATRQIPFVTYSSDLVFDGGKGTPYVESDTPNPLCVYGQAKAIAERQVLAEMPQAIVIRTSTFFGPWDSANLLTRAMHALRAGERYVVPDDMTTTPTYVPDLAHTTLDLLLDRESGIWHLSHGTLVTWSNLVQMTAERLAISLQSLVPCSVSQLGFEATRPHWSPLESERGWFMPSLNDALDRYADAFAERDSRASPERRPLADSYD